MTNEQLVILNSLLTFAAENMPGGLRPEERQAISVFGVWAAGGPFYAMSLGSTSIKINNDGKALASFLVEERRQRLLEAHILGPHRVSLKLGPGDSVELDKTEGSTIFMPLRVSVDVKNTLWVIERYTASTDTWEEVGETPAQMATDFQE